MLPYSTLLTLAIGLIGYIDSVAGSGDYGPNTCLEGWVWREAYTGDVVCVTPATRAQAATDNALAASRINPLGASGPKSCINGYVWRQADATDYVCVTPATRTLTAADNAQANNRRASLNLSFGRWFQPHCDTITCGFPSFVVIGDHFNFAPVRVGIFWISNDEPIWMDSFTPTANASWVAGGFSIDAPVADCAPGSSVPPGTPINAYIQAWDSNSDRNSTAIYVAAACVNGINPDP